MYSNIYDVYENNHIYDSPVTQQTYPYKENIEDDIKDTFKLSKNHPYYIKKFINSFSDSDIISLASTHDPEIYDHISNCKYCRVKINIIMKKRLLKEVMLEKKRLDKKNKKVSNDSNDNSNFNLNNMYVFVIVVVLVLFLLFIDIILRILPGNK